jgi:hypothetical protein
VNLNQKIMKSIFLKKAFPYMLVLLFSLFQLTMFAQNTGTSGSDDGGTSKTVTTETTTTTTEWYTQPWVWIVGAAVLIIVLVALLRGNSNDTREVSRTTVIKD